MKSLLLIPGDGIGNEVVAATRHVLSSFAADVSLREVPGGYDYWTETGQSLPSDIGGLVAAADGVLFGATGTPHRPPPGYESPILRLRKLVEGVANLRFCANPVTGVDILIVRECTEGMYGATEVADAAGATATVRTSVAATRAVAAEAAAAACARGVPVTIVHKANVLRITDGLFRDVSIETIEHLGAAWEEEFVDAAAYHMIRQPSRYSVMLMNSSNGDILSDVGAAVCGGLGLVPSILVGANGVLGEPIHGSAPDIAGKNLADPIGTLLSAAHVLHALGLGDASARLRSAIGLHWRAHPERSLRTDEVADDVLRRLRDAS